MPDTPGPAAPRGWSVATDLVRLAQAWPTTCDPDEEPQDAYAQAFPLVHRCGDTTCAQRIVPLSLENVLAHLLNAHGYRMDGVSYDNHNRQVTTAARELESLHAHR